MVQRGSQTEYVRIRPESRLGAVLLWRGVLRGQNPRMLLSTALLERACRAEINQDRPTLWRQHDVGRLDVPMQPLTGMHFCQGIAQFLRDPPHLVQGKGPRLLKPSLQRLPLQVFHYDIRRAVLQEHVVHVHDTPGLEACDHPRFLQRTVLRAAEIVRLRCGHGHARGDADRAQIPGKQFLDGHGPLQILMRALVGDAEATFSQYAPYGELALLQGMTGRQVARRHCGIRGKRRAATDARPLAGRHWRLAKRANRVGHGG